MAANVFAGKEIADAIKSDVRVQATRLHETGIRPGLVVVRVGEDEASAGYVGSKVRTAEELGLMSEHIHLPDQTSEEVLLAIVDDLNQRDDVDGILVQLPLPKHIDESLVLERIDPEKDVDGFHPVNAGRLMQG